MDEFTPGACGALDAKDGRGNGAHLDCMWYSVMSFLRCSTQMQYSFLYKKPIAGIWLNAEDILLILRQEPEVAHLAGLYLKWLTLGLPGYGFNSVCRYSILPSLAYESC